MTEFTHNFEFKLGTPPKSHIIEGEVEFNLDGQASFCETDPGGMTLRQDKLINNLFDITKDLFQEFGGLEKIEIIKK